MAATGDADIGHHRDRLLTHQFKGQRVLMVGVFHRYHHRICHVCLVGLSQLSEKPKAQRHDDKRRDRLIPKGFSCAIVHGAMKYRKSEPVAMCQPAPPVKIAVSVRSDWLACPIS